MNYIFKFFRFSFHSNKKHPAQPPKRSLTFMGTIMGGSVNMEKICIKIVEERLESKAVFLLAEDKPDKTRVDLST